VLPRAVPIVEAMVALTLTDALLVHIAQSRIFLEQQGQLNCALGKKLSGLGIIE
jgi:chorismate synthase